MKHSFFFVLLALLISSSTDSATGSVSSKTVSNSEELHEAIANARPGDNITLANGTWEDVQIRFVANGTEDKPITLRAETPGEVIIQGKSDLKFGGDYLVVDGLYFKNGFSPSRAVISFELNRDTVANHSTITNCVIKDYNQNQRNFIDLWVLFKGRHNQMDHCYLSGKTNKGPTVRVDLKGLKNINNHHQIINNHFGPRPPKGGPSAETIQIGSSSTSMSPSYTLVANNLFEKCDGEVEVISSKTNFNEFRNNVFYESEGSLVTRHGNYCTIDGNYFIGSEYSDECGGVRLIGTGHTVTNNYFYNLNGENFRSPLAVMNGIPKSPLNRYIQVTDVIIAHNSWVNCSSPLQFGVGSNVSEKDVLPASEIRSARPIRTTVANNLIYNTRGDKNPIVAHDLLDGIKFKSNVINNQGVDFEPMEGIEPLNFKLKKIGKNLLVPTADFPEVDVFSDFGFEGFNKDLFGTSRDENNSVGAIVESPTDRSIFEQSNYGATWYSTKLEGIEPTIHVVNPSMNLADVIAKAENEDVIELEAGNYEIPASLKIDKTITIRNKGGGDPSKTVLSYQGPASTPLFEMNPNGDLELEYVKLQGNKSQHAFATLKENMSSGYKLKLVWCEVENFNYVLKAYKYSFAYLISLHSSSFTNCLNGLELSEEIEDKGEYNAEYIDIIDCVFERIEANVIDYYRGGYDESTVGGNLLVSNSTFTNCGAKEKNGILLNTYGIINVDIMGNTFENNPVKQVAQLWGAKNNRHSENTIINSGKLVVEENLKLNLLY